MFAQLCLRPRGLCEGFVSQRWTLALWSTSWPVFIYWPVLPLSYILYLQFTILRKLWCLWLYMLSNVFIVCVSLQKKVFSEGENDVRVFQSLTSTRTLGTNTTQREIPRTEKDKHTPRGHTLRSERQRQKWRDKEIQRQKKKREVPQISLPLSPAAQWLMC